MASNSLVTTPERDITVFRHLSEIPFVTFPMRLESILMVVCTGGSISARVDTDTRLLRQGDVLVLRPGHYIAECREYEDFEGIFATMSRERLERTLPAMQYIVPMALQMNGVPIVHLTQSELQHLSAQCSLLGAQLASHTRPFADVALGALCEMIFYTTLGIYSSRMNETPGQSRRQELLVKFIERLESDYRTQRTVKYYADKLFVTPKHLSAVIKESSGKTAGQWIDQRVILEAKMLLRSTGLNVQEISAMLNFANQSFFGKYFKHITGISPREYRSQLPGK